MIDNHTHLFNVHVDFSEYWQDFENAGIDKVSMLCVSDPFQADVNDNAVGLYLKQRFPEKVFLFPGCEYSFDSEDFRCANSVSLEEQVEIYADIGVDGWKCLEGKPAFHKYDLSSSFYRGFLTALTDHGLPLLIHVGDPIEFWDKEKLPQWAFEEWLYDDQVPTLSLLRQDALKMAAQNPELRIILPHFFFLGYELDKAEKILKEHTNILFDLAPGVEMFFGFSVDPIRTRDFFETFSERILFGTDRGIAEMPAKPRAEMITRFLSTDDVFDPPHTDRVMWPDRRAPISGINLSRESFQKITCDNFIQYIGKTPKPLNPLALRSEVARLKSIYPDKDDVQFVCDKLCV